MPCILVVGEAGRTHLLGKGAGGGAAAVGLHRVPVELVVPGLLVPVRHASDPEGEHASTPAQQQQARRPQNREWIQQ